MLENLISSLVISAISAITWIAYKHPKGYEAFLPNLFILVLSIPLGIAFFALMTAYSESSAMIAVVKMDSNSLIATHSDAIQHIEQSASYALIATGISVVAFLYLFFLAQLPKFFTAENLNNEQAKK